jgi:hypothetical protein
VSGDDGFLSRWSQRKREAKAKEQEVLPTDAPAEEVSAEPEQEFDLASLPDLESLTAETDISLFMQKGVPEALRNAALRRMWVLDPAIRNYVGEALDYAWDWNAPGGVPGSGGEITEQALSFARSLFSESPLHKDVNEEPQVEQTDIAVQQLEEDQAATSAENKEDQAPAAEQQELSELSTEAETPAKKLRHGGALPRNATMS